MSNKPSLGNIRARRRRSVTVSQQNLVNIEPLRDDTTLPLTVTPAFDGVDLTAWIKDNRERIDRLLLKHGAILFRGFDVYPLEKFQTVVDAMSEDLLDYTYRSTPRSEVEGKVYTSTEYPADQSIPPHNEMSYTDTWPMKIWFGSLKPAERGGETPLADSRRVYQKIDPAIRDTFVEKGVMYVRNYGEGLDLPWQEVFQTDDKSEVEAFCSEAGIECEWKGNDQLRTHQVCQAVAMHPQTGEPVWFNQAHLFHVTSLPEEIREMLLAEFGEEDLPRNTYYGDGTPIEESVLDEIRRVYVEESVAFAWERGDLEILDNMLVAHARNPYEGERELVVSMAEPMSLDQLSN